MSKENIWVTYSPEAKTQYVRSIQALGALSPLFRQKDEDENNHTAYISSKYQETVFARFFNGRVVDRGNDPYDVMIPSPISNRKDLVGIKTFLNSSSSMQKIMQFKSIANTENWSAWITDGEYDRLIRRISYLRNQKLHSAQNTLAGPDTTPQEAFGNIYYHYLSPAEDGTVFVGQADYGFMKEDSLRVIESRTNTQNRITSILFTDDVHEYKYTPADSTLYMRFSHTSRIEADGDIVDDFIVRFFEDPHTALIRMYTKEFETEVDLEPGNRALESVDVVEQMPEEEEKEYYVFPLFRLHRYRDTEAGEVDPNSGLNVRMGKPKNKGSNKPRPVEEVEIKIPLPVQFHKEHPFFFGSASDGTPITKMIKKNSNWKGVYTNPDDRTFELVLTQSGVSMPAIVTGDNLKQIMSKNSQKNLGRWILSQVFMLRPYERLNRTKLDELGLDGIKLTRLDDGVVGMEFIKVSVEDLPHLWPREPDLFESLATVLPNISEEEE